MLFLLVSMCLFYCTLCPLGGCLHLLLSFGRIDALLKLAYKWSFLKMVLLSVNF